MIADIVRNIHYQNSLFPVTDYTADHSYFAVDLQLQPEMITAAIFISVTFLL